MLKHLTSLAQRFNFGDKLIDFLGMCVFDVCLFSQFEDVFRVYLAHSCQLHMLILAFFLLVCAWTLSMHFIVGAIQFCESLNMLLVYS